MVDPAPLSSWFFPSIEELDAYARRRREERGWVLETVPAPVVDPVSVIVSLEECD